MFDTIPERMEFTLSVIEGKGQLTIEDPLSFGGLTN